VRPVLRGLACATLLASSMLGLMGASAGAAAATVTAAAVGGPQHVEARIQEMHARLQITAAQEELWKPVAQTMRDNQLALEPLIADREKNAKTATAVEDLRSFAEVSEAHASGIRKFAAVFEPLYTAMAESQKKDADTLFRSGAGKMGKSK
jgi:Skp family chaperone for outer membrane proteins